MHSKAVSRRHSRAASAAVGLFLALLVALQSPAWLSAEEPPRWVRVGVAPWQPRDSCAEAVFAGRMWLLGGWFDSFQPAPRDVWSSADGAAWKLESPEAPWNHSDLSTAVVFEDRLWMMAGWYNGRLSDASASAAVWSTRDGARWEQATASAEWSPRLGTAAAVMGGKLWLAGGVERYYDGTRESLKNDVWFTTDGAHWTQAIEHAPWPARAYHALVSMNGRLWLFGGGNYQPEYEAHNDVWSSADGANWERATEHAPWPARIWFSGEVFRNRLWVLGGWSNHPFENHNDVWHSGDGREWTRLETPEVWTPRHEMSAWVKDDALWIGAGHAAPLTSEVWRLELR